MKHSPKSNTRRRKSPRPLLELLESRLQPGSIVLGQGPGLSLLGDSLVSQDEAPSRSDGLVSSQSFRVAPSITPGATASASLPAAATVSANAPSTLPSQRLFDNLAADGLNDDLSALLGIGRSNSAPLLATQTPVVSANLTGSALGSAGMIESPVGVAAPPIVQADPIISNGPGLSSVALTPTQLPMPTVTSTGASLHPANLQATALNVQGAGNAISPFMTTLNFSTFVGGPGQDSLAGVAVDGQGNIYVAGSYEANAGTISIFAAAYDKTGVGLWGVDLNRDGPVDQAHGIALFTDSAGNVSVYLAGSLSNTDPVTHTDGFVALLSSTDGSLINAAISNNSDFEGIAVDPQNGNVFVSGYATDPNGGAYNILAAAVDSTLSTTLYSATISLQDANMHSAYSFALGSQSLAIDSKDNSYIVGTLTTKNTGDNSPVVVAFNGFNDPDKQILWAPVSYPNPVSGGAGSPGGIVYQAGSIYVTGTLFDSTNENPMSGLNSDLLLAKLDATSGAQTYTNQWLVTDGMATPTRIGDWTGNALIVNAAGEAIVVGAAFDPTGSAMFPATKGVDVHVTHFSADGTATQLTTSRPENTFGGSALDVGNAIVADPTNSNSAIVVGMTQSNDFPTTPNANQKNYGGGPSDGFLASIQV